MYLRTISNFRGDPLQIKANSHLRLFSAHRKNSKPIQPLIPSRVYFHEKKYRAGFLKNSRARMPAHSRSSRHKLPPTTYYTSSLLTSPRQKQQISARSRRAPNISICLQNTAGARGALEVRVARGPERRQIAGWAEPRASRLTRQDSLSPLAYYILYIHAGIENLFFARARQQQMSAEKSHLPHPPLPP